MTKQSGRRKTAIIIRKGFAENSVNPAGLHVIPVTGFRSLQKTMSLVTTEHGNAVRPDAIAGTGSHPCERYARLSLPAAVA